MSGSIKRSILCGLAACLMAIPLPAFAQWAAEEDFEADMAAPSEAFKAGGADAAEEALNVLERKWGPEGLDDPIAQGRIAYERGRIDLIGDHDVDAIAHFDAALAIYAEQDHTPASFVLSAYRDRGSANWGLSRLVQAESDARQALAIALGDAAVSPRLTASAHFMLARILDFGGKAKEAHAQLGKALEIAIADPDSDPYDLAEMVGYLINLRSLEQGDAYAMVSVAKDAIRTMEARTSGPSLQLAGLYASLGNSFEKLGRLDEAASATRKAIAIVIAARAGDAKGDANTFIQEAYYRHNLAATLRLMGDYQAAQQELDQMTALIATSLPEDHPVRIFISRQFSLNQIDLGNRQEGRQMLEAGYLAFQSKVLPTELRLIAWQNDLGQLALRDGRYSDATRYFDKAVEGLELRARERRIDAVISRKEWEQQQAVYEGSIEADARLAGL